MDGHEKRDGAVENISICGNAAGSALASEQNNTATLTLSGPDPAERHRVLVGLAAVQVELVELPDREVRETRASKGAAVEDGRKEESNKRKGGGFIGAVSEAPREGAEFAGQTGKLAPSSRRYRTGRAGNAQA